MYLKQTINNKVKLKMDGLGSSKAALLLGFATLLSFMSLLGVFGIYGVDKVHEHLDRIVNLHMQKIDIAMHMRRNARERTLSIYKMLIHDDPFEQDDAWMDFKSQGEQFAKNRQRMGEMDITEDEFELLAAQGKTTSVNRVAQNDIVNLIQQEKFEEAKQLLIDTAVPVQNAVLKLLDNLIEQQQLQAAHAVNRSTQIYHRTRSVIVVSVVVTFILSAIIAVIVFRRLVRDEREIKLKNSMVMRALDKAEEANEAKSEFLANMNHELRTPINAIIGYSEMIMDELHDRDKSLSLGNDLQKINLSAKHLLSLIGNILDIAQVESGKHKLIIEEINLQQLVNDIIHYVTPIAEENNNSLSVELSPRLSSIRLDRRYLQQIMSNLLVNACTYTFNGEVKLGIDVLKAGGKDTLRLLVSDNGVGIAQEHHQRVFQPFMQVDNSYTREHDGVGLGLTICKRNCDFLGGRIDLESEEGVGTRVTVELPLHHEQQFANGNGPHYAQAS